MIVEDLIERLEGFLQSNLAAAEMLRDTAHYNGHDTDSTQHDWCVSEIKALLPAPTLLRSQQDRIEALQCRVRELEGGK